MRTTTARCPEPDCCYYGQPSASSCACIDDNEPSICGSCSGSGEGRFDGTTCRACKGMGEIHHHKETA